MYELTLSLQPCKKKKKAKLEMSLCMKNRLFYSKTLINHSGKISGTSINCILSALSLSENDIKDRKKNNVIVKNF